MDIDRLFLKHASIPVVVKEKSTGRVLSLAFMNREALEKTIATGNAWYSGRTSNKLWSRGESGNTQKVYAIYCDCDHDSLLIKVHQTGYACHKGHRSCFRDKIWEAPKENETGEK